MAKSVASIGGQIHVATITPADGSGSNRYTTLNPTSRWLPWSLSNYLLKSLMHVRARQASMV